MKNSFSTPSLLRLTVLIITLILTSCSKSGQDISPIKVSKIDSVILPRDGEIDYNDWVAQVNSIQEDYFGSEDIMELDFDYFYDKYLDLYPSEEITYLSLFESYLKRNLMSLEYVSIGDYLQASPFMTENGSTALLDLKADVLTMIGSLTTYSTIQTFLENTAEDALEDEELNVVEQASLYLACVGIEAAINPELDWSNISGPDNKPSSRIACNFQDIAIDFLIAGAISAVVWNAINYLGGHIGNQGTDDQIISDVTGSLSQLSITNLIGLSSNALPIILIFSALSSIIFNCWDVIIDFFENIWEGISGFIINIFGNASPDCDEPHSISAVALDCTGDHIRFTANQAGDDIVAYMWNNTNTIPQAIVTQTRSFVFESTNDNVTIRVTGICSDPEESPDEVEEVFDISDLIEDDPVSSVLFVDWPSNPTINQTYRFTISNPAGNNEILTWSGNTGTTIQGTGPNWADVLFIFTGNRSVTATITDICSENFSTDTKQLFVN